MTVTKPKQPKWLQLFRRYLKEIRIQSKHTSEDIDGTGVPLTLWTSQSRVLEQICQGLEDDIHVFYILKSRQLGVTTITIAIILFWLAYHPNTIACLVSDGPKNYAKNRETVRSYVNSLSKFMGKSFSLDKKYGAKDNQFGFTFSNKSRLDMLTAGNKSAWGEGEGYVVGHLTETASYGREEGISSFRHSMAPENPRALYIFESTAHGNNHWRDMWEAAMADEHSSRCIFVGWWSHDLQRIPQTDRRFKRFGTAPPTPEETERIVAVKRLYDFDISMEQLAWYRMEMTRPNSGETDMAQNQPYTADEAFVQSGVSFFGPKRVQARIDEIRSAPVGGVEDGGFGYKAYEFYLADEYHLCRVEALTQDIRTERIKLRVWEYPNPEGVYVIGCDPAGGRSELSNHHCLDQETEILTKAGWKRHDEVVVGDEAVCFDCDTGSYAYGPVQRVIRRNVDEPLYRFAGRGVDILATADHRMVHRYKHGYRYTKITGWTVCTAEELAQSGRAFIHVPSSRAPCGQGIQGLTLDMCRALGWILSDGFIAQSEPVIGGPRESQKHVRPYIVLAQARVTNKAGINISAAMEEVFSRLAPDASIIKTPETEAGTEKITIRIGSRVAAQFMRWLPGQVCLKKDRRIPRSLLTETSQQQADALFTGILEGDGSWATRDAVWSKVCPGAGEGLADDVQELAIRCGWSATKGSQIDPSSGNLQWIIHLSKRDHRRIEFQGLEHYAGPVWCVTVPTGAFVARRRGYGFVTGNCVSVWRVFADKMVQVAEWADGIPETRHCAWILAYLAGQYKNCRINIDLTGGIGTAVMQSFDDLRTRMRSELYQTEIRQAAEREIQRKREDDPSRPKRSENAPPSNFDFDDFLGAASWYLYRRIDSPGPGYQYNTVVSQRIKYHTMNILRDAFVTGLLEIRSIPLLEEMADVVDDHSKIDIGASAPGRLRDDRTFALALANSTWVENVRGGLIAQGITYQSARAKESGELSPIADALNRRIYNIMVAADQEMDAPPPRTFMEKRGLL